MNVYIVFALQAEQREVETANAMLESEVKNIELQVQRKLFEQVSPRDNNTTRSCRLLGRFYWLCARVCGRK